jgi:hypothetical protein
MSTNKIAFGRFGNNRLFIGLAIMTVLIIGTASIIAIAIINSSQAEVATEPDLSGRQDAAPTGDAPVDHRGTVLPPAARHSREGGNPLSFLNATLPLTLSGRFGDVQYEQKDSATIWHATTELDCEAAATDVLTVLQAEQWQLKETGYLDLFGNAWGCIAIKGTAPNLSVLTITLMPTTNAMRLNIVELHTPSQGDVQPPTKTTHEP